MLISRKLAAEKACEWGVYETFKTYQYEACVTGVQKKKAIY